MILCRMFLCLLVVLAFNSGSLAAQLSNKEKVESVFVPPKPILRSPPTYPKSERKRANTGYVEVMFMVNKEGNVYEPAVIASSSLAFEPQSLRAVKKYKFEPATLNGEPVNGSYIIRIKFELDRQENQVNQSFSYAYKRAIKELGKTKPDKDKIAKQIRRMETGGYLSLYANVNLNLVKYLYASAFGTKQEQINAIEQIVLFESKDIDNLIALKRSQIVAIKTDLVSLYIQIQDYGSAVERYYDLLKIDRDAYKKFGESIKLINQKVCVVDQSLFQPIQVSEKGSVFTFIQKSTFGLTNVVGQIDEFKVRCDRTYSNFKYRQGVEYKIPKNVNNCHLEILGGPGATADLYQLFDNCG